MVRADDDRHPPRDLAHGREERQAPVGELDGLVRERRRAGAQERVDERQVRGEVQVGEQHEVRAQVPVLRRDGLLDLEDEVRSPRLVHGPEPRADGRVGVVGQAGAQPRAPLHDDVVPGPHQVQRACGREGDATLVVLDLGGHSDAHDRSFSGSGRTAGQSP
ncbi:hypothetical protein GCM10025864_23210 [Luteimicrobium album]|uniref:Uncharacterized protein n=1 Tax=Luteimicrobium album TaxID=1054550 RepID=A0ABQ6I254_9MICO|nr:hypothetical protein GCM10025864_23210 [Luteimicrobium album]